MYYWFTTVSDNEYSDIFNYREVTTVLSSYCVKQIFWFVTIDWAKLQMFNLSLMMLLHITLVR